MAQADAAPNRAPETQQMMLRFSGKVSGILDDLSDAMAMLQVRTINSADCPAMHVVACVCAVLLSSFPASLSTACCVHMEPDRRLLVL